MSTQIIKIKSPVNGEAIYVAEGPISVIHRGCPGFHRMLEGFTHKLNFTPERLELDDRIANQDSNVDISHLTKFGRYVHHRIRETHDIHNIVGPESVSAFISFREEGGEMIEYPIYDYTLYLAAAIEPYYNLAGERPNNNRVEYPILVGMSPQYVSSSLTLPEHTVDLYLKWETVYNVSGESQAEAALLDTAYIISPNTGKTVSHVTGRVYHNTNPRRDEILSLVNHGSCGEQSPRG